MIFLCFAILLFSGFVVAAKNDPYDNVNLLIGNAGFAPGLSGGMIPSTAPPFAMTRWIAQTRQNYVSMTPYNWTDNAVHGFQGTRQPAIWMGESGPAFVVPGVALTEEGFRGVKADFESRGMVKKNGSESISPALYSISLDDGLGGEILAQQSATSRVGHLRFTFTGNGTTPYILLESSRPSVITSTPTNITYPNGTISILLSHGKVHEICGSNTERQDWIITPISTRPHASNFAGYYCARFNISSIESTSYGIIQNTTNSHLSTTSSGPLLSAYVFFEPGSNVDIRVGTSFISIDQARANIDAEIPDGTSFEDTVASTKAAWEEKLNRFQVEGASAVQQEVFYTGVTHALQYPYEQFEQGRYYSGYDGQVHNGQSYTGYSIWDTFRAEWAFLILFAPERLPGMVTSMLNDFSEGGRLPMWKNIVETNIMVGTHADSLVAEAFVKGVTGFDTELAWEAVWKDATVPPINDLTTVYSDRQENVDYEARGGLNSTYAQNGWVADDIHSESGSRTLDYAYDDYAVYKVALALGKPANITDFLLQRSLRAPTTIYNNDTGFVEARDANGSWAGENNGWTEGDKWIYSFDAIQDIPGLIERRGGNKSFVASLDAHFDGGHNYHPNEPSHHIPYLYALAGAAYKTQERVREIAQSNYNNTLFGLSGNDDCGQMSSWYIFSAMGFYPVTPVSGEYVVGSPFFDKITISLPPKPQDHTNEAKILTISALGAPSKPYIKSLTINGKAVDSPIIRHEDIVNGGTIEFEMSDVVEAWGNGVLMSQ